MENLTIDQAWEYLEDNGIATNDELVLVTNINGYNIEALDSIVYARTGLNTVDQLINEENE